MFLGSDSAEEFSGSEGEQAAKKKEKAARKAERVERKKTSKPSGEKTTKKKKKTKLPGQPKKPMSAYFMWLNAEGRERVKVSYYPVHVIWRVLPSNVAFLGLYYSIFPDFLLLFCRSLLNPSLSILKSYGSIRIKNSVS